MRSSGIRLALCGAFAIGLAAPLAAQTRPPVNVELMPWQVVEQIVTGSVIDVRGIWMVRLAGVEDAGELSRAFLAGIVSSQPVRVLPTAHSSGGLTHALVFMPDGRCVNVEMLRLGYARAKPEPGFDRAAEFRGLEEDARKARRGLWAPTATPIAQASLGATNSFSARTFHLAAGGGVTFGDARRDWHGSIEAGAFLARALAFYVTASHLHDLGDDDAAAPERAWLGAAGVRIVTPARAPLRPYLRAGGGYMRIEPDAAGALKRDEPFWEAGVGLMIAAGPLHLDAGYTFMRVERTDAGRAFLLAGVRF